MREYHANAAICRLVVNFITLRPNVCIYTSIESDSPTNLTSCQAESRLVVPSFPPRYVKTNANVVYGEICRSKCVGDMQIAEGRVWTEGG